MGRWLACGAFSSMTPFKFSLGRPCGAFPLKEEGESVSGLSSLAIFGSRVWTWSGVCVWRESDKKDGTRSSDSSFNVAGFFVVVFFENRVSRQMSAICAL